MIQQKFSEERLFNSTGLPWIKNYKLQWYTLTSTNEVLKNIKMFERLSLKKNKQAFLTEDTFSNYCLAVSPLYFTSNFDYKTIKTNTQHTNSD